MHGGAGSGAPLGNKNALKHGFYTMEAIEARRKLAELKRALKDDDQQSAAVDQEANSDCIGHEANQAARSPHEILSLARTERARHQLAAMIQVTPAELRQEAFSAGHDAATKSNQEATEFRLESSSPPVSDTARKILAVLVGDGPQEVKEQLIGLINAECERRGLSAQGRKPTAVAGKAAAEPVVAATNVIQERTAPKGQIQHAAATRPAAATRQSKENSAPALSDVTHDAFALLRGEGTREATEYFITHVLAECASRQLAVWMREAEAQISQKPAAAEQEAAVKVAPAPTARLYSDLLQGALAVLEGEGPRETRRDLIALMWVQCITLRLKHRERMQQWKTPPIPPRRYCVRQ
jgi:hypothetical protein